MTERPAATTAVLRCAAIEESRRRTLYALYARYYDATSYARFAQDLAGKDYVVELRDGAGRMCGFSTLATYAREIDGRRVRVLFSGDTVVDAASRGQQALAFAWVRLAATIRAESTDPLYWLLICKGHRTYRYLPAFSRTFHPAAGVETPPAAQRLIDALARERFGNAYDAARGVVRFAESQGHLRADLAEVPAIHAHLPEVAFFLARNPGYARGDELVCLCELDAANLRPMAQRAFAAAERAARAGTPDLVDRTARIASG